MAALASGMLLSFAWLIGRDNTMTFVVCIVAASFLAAAALSFVPGLSLGAGIIALAGLIALAGIYELYTGLIGGYLFHTRRIRI
jgi:hypothetical protein